MLSFLLGVLWSTFLSWFMPGAPWAGQKLTERPQQRWKKESVILSRKNSSHGETESFAVISASITTILPHADWHLGARFFITFFLKRDSRDPNFPLRILFQSAWRHEKVREFEEGKARICFFPPPPPSPLRGRIERGAWSLPWMNEWCSQEFPWEDGGGWT